MVRNILLEIAGHGLSQTQISLATGIPQPTISRLFTGAQKEVGYTYGKKIEQLRDGLTPPTPTPDREAA